MNLIFTDGHGFADFPYQTTTAISKEVISAETKEEKLEILKSDIYRRFGENGNTYYQEIERMINQGWGWELTII
jgi:hypothetical protein